MLAGPRQRFIAWPELIEWPVQTAILHGQKASEFRPRR
jgi:hypothetical protein